MADVAPTKRLLLIDLENKQKVDLSPLDETFKAIIFVGAHQNPPKAASRPATAHRFSRVQFLKISGAGKNALDFHIAFELGRTFETARDTECFVLSADKGFDPLLAHLNAHGMLCRRIESVLDLLPRRVISDGEVAPPREDAVTCLYCRKASTVPLHGGHWCANCGRFGRPPDRRLLPSAQPGFAEPPRWHAERSPRGSNWRLVCGWCHQHVDMTGGIHDDGEWMCGGCVSELSS